MREQGATYLVLSVFVLAAFLFTLLDWLEVEYKAGVLGGHTDNSSKKNCQIDTVRLRRYKMKQTATFENNTIDISHCLSYNRAQADTSR